MDRPRFQRPSRRLRPTLDGLERKALLSADPAAIVPAGTATDPVEMAPPVIRPDPRTTVPTSPADAPDLVALAATSGSASPGLSAPTPPSTAMSFPDLGSPPPDLALGAATPAGSTEQQGLIVPTLAMTSLDGLAASSSSTSIPTDQITLDGSIRGTLRRSPGATVGAQPAFVLSGKGRHATIGKARVDGTAMPSNVEALPSATLTLRTTKGTITLTLTGLPESSARPALAYRYTVQSGTGAYVGMTASGTAQLGLPRGLPRSARAAAPFTLLLQSDHIAH